MFKIETNISEFIASLPIHLTLKQNVKRDIAEFIRKDIETNLSQGTGIDGSSVKAKKYGGRLFVQSGTLLNSIVKQVYKSGASVFVSPVRAQIASYINNGTNRMPARQFFGISQRVQLKIDGYLLNKKFEDLFENRFK